MVVVLSYPFVRDKKVGGYAYRFYDKSHIQIYDENPLNYCDDLERYILHRCV